MFGLNEHICFMFLFATGYGAEFVSMLMFFLAHFRCMCMRVLIADGPNVCPVGLLVRKTARTD